MCIRAAHHLSHRQPANKIHKEEEYGLKDEKNDLEEENSFHNTYRTCSTRQIGHQLLYHQSIPTLHQLVS